jgi:XTP/dITP diphosphohydrolase
MSSRPALDLVIATHNRGKIHEVHAALQQLPLELHSLTEFPHVSPVCEVGQTYRENAILKALSYSKQTRISALADDSGLEVDALDGRPGVFSARFGGENASDRERIELLLSELSSQPKSDRRARFVCSMALAGWPGIEEQTGSDESRLCHVETATCEGIIAPAVRGINGFGFDPVFVPTGYISTFGELPSEVKARISHRAKALNRMRVFLNRWLTQT